MSKKRDVQDDERSLWDEVMRGVRRMRGRVPGPAKSKSNAEAKAEPKPKKTVPIALPARPATGVVQAKPSRVKSGFGVDGATAERLRRGKVEPDAVLDLHGMTQAQAHTRLLSFVRRAHEHEYRCVLIVTGKGSPLAGRDEEARGFAMPIRTKAGVLRTQVPRWLEEDELRPLVVGVHSAHQKHGGGGALYVYLRRKRSRG